MFCEGNKALREARYEEAVKAYKSAIQLCPDFYIYHENLGQAFEGLGREEDAIKAYRRALEFNGVTLISKLALERLTSKTSCTVRGEKTWKDPDAVALIRSVNPISEQELRAEYIAKGLDKVEDTFVLYRVIGNDLYPRHEKGQSRKNVEFILRNEKEFPGCEKRWVLNRIVDAGERAAILELMDRYKQSYIEIPFVYDEFVKAGWDFSRFDKDGFFSSKEYLALEPREKDRALMAAYRQKNCYLMNNNGARNAALKAGRGCAKWVLPWDGNCFLTESAWQEIVDAIKLSPFLKYFVVPMERVTNNEDLLNPGFSPNPAEEPQLIFRSDTKEEFNLEYPYGRRPKVELFWRLGIPGAWDKWVDDPWDPERRDLSNDYQQFGVAGWVARLFSGQKNLEMQDKDSSKKRGLAREEAIRSAINYITVSRGPFRSKQECVFYSTKLLDTLGEDARRIILENARKALCHQTRSVVDKLEIAPSGDIHDYFHPAPYWWPNPHTSDGLPYVKRDGERVPGTVMGEVESARYDRSSIQELFDNGVSLALAWKMTGDMTYARHAADALRMWFVSPETRMNPHLRYSQVRRGSNKDLGNGRGNIETKDFYFYLDAVRLIEQSGAMSSSDQNEFRRWLREFLDWLLVSQQGVYECQAENNHGTYYDLQVAAIAAFLDEKELLFKTLIRARNRLSVQFSPEGWQHAEMQRTQTAHYCCFNLQGWLYLSLLARRYGDDLFSHEEKGVALLPQAVKWLSQFIEKKWPYEQIVEFDSDRFAPIVHLAEELGMAIDLPASFRERISKLGDRKPVFHPHDAVSPYWGLLRGVSRFKLLHVVVMRFGIGIFDQQWLEHRFHLLQSITIPSLKQERWGSGMFFVVQIDELLSEEWQERLNVALEGLPFVLQKLQLHSDRRQGLTDFCNKKCEEEGFTHVLTTRIDDDDAFSSGTLDRIRVRASVLFGKGVEFAGFGIQKTLRFLASDSKVLPVSNVEPDAIGLTFFAKAFTEKNIYSYNHRKFRGVIEQFGIFEWLEGCVALYTIHRLSDSDFVSRKKRFGRDDAYVITKSEVAMFGIDKERLSVWVDVDSKYPVLSDGKTTEFVSVKELEIKKERKRLSVLGLNDSDEMRRLLSERVELGRNIISELSSKI